MPLAAIASVIRQIPSAPTRSNSIRTVSGGEVHAVADDLEDRLAAAGLGQAGGHRAGGAVVQRRHAVEDVGDQRPAAARRGSSADRSAAHAVAASASVCPTPGRMPRPASSAGQRVSAGAFRGEGHLGQRAAAPPADSAATPSASTATGRRR